MTITHPMPQSPSDEPAHGSALYHCRRVLALVQALHARGYQRLRIAPGLSSSGSAWRCAIVPASQTLHAHGAIATDAAPLSAFYTSAMGGAYFDWSDAASDAAPDLADKFVARFPDLVAAGRGRDWAYAGWYAEMLGYAERGALPVAYADWLDDTADPRWLPTTRSVRSGLPMPPPGEANNGAGAEALGRVPEGTSAAPTSALKDAAHGPEHDTDADAMLTRVEQRIREFFVEPAAGEDTSSGDAFPNEASLQHELAIYLRRAVPDGWRVHLERPASWYRPDATGLIKKELDVAVVDPASGNAIAIELKCPRQGQHPEQMFKACQDLQFLEELIAAGFQGGVFVMHVRDPLFYAGGAQAGIYAHFRGGKPISGSIQKPTGARDVAATMRGSYTPTWTAGEGPTRYWVQRVPPTP